MLDPNDGLMAQRAVAETECYTPGRIGLAGALLTSLHEDWQM